MAKPKPVRYSCVEVDGSPCRDFSPSGIKKEPKPRSRMAQTLFGQSGTPEGYKRYIEGCEQLRNDEAAFRSEGCKREAHVYLEAGRRAQRYTHVSYPKDPSKGGPGKEHPEADAQGETHPSEKTELRWQDKSAPLQARTQSPDVRDLESHTLETQIRDGLRRFVGNKAFLVIPRHVEDLVEAGVPYLAAEALVERAPGRAFPVAVIGEAQVTPLQEIVAKLGKIGVYDDKVSLLGNLRRPITVFAVQVEGQIRRLAEPNVPSSSKPSFNQQIAAYRVRAEAEGQDPDFTKNEIERNVKEYIDGFSQQIQNLNRSCTILIGYDPGDKEARKLWNQLVQETISLSSVEAKKAKIKKILGTQYLNPDDRLRAVLRIRRQPELKRADRAALISAIGQQVLSATAQDLENEIAYFEIPYEKREHSVSARKGDKLPDFDYRSLAGGLSFDSLPVLLARFVRRGKRFKPLRRLAKMNSSHPIHHARPNGSPSDALKELLMRPDAKPIPVPGRPGYVMVYSKKRDAVIETTAKRAAAWQIIGDTARATQSYLRDKAQEEAQRVRDANPGLLKTETVQPQLAVTNPPIRENPPMSFQFTPAHFNPSAAQSASRAGGSWVLKRAYEILNQGECSLSKAMHQAWQEQKTGVLKNPRRSHRAPTAKELAAREIAKKVLKRAHSVLLEHGCSVKQAVVKAWAEYKARAGAAPAAPARPSGARRAPGASAASGESAGKRAMELYHSGKAKSLKEAWAQVKSGAKNNPGAFPGESDPYALFSDAPADYSVHHPVYEQFIGQFSTGEKWTAGIQPMNRRNPARNNPAPMTARFPTHCVECGGSIERGEQIVDSGKRGPKGGKKMAHANCGR